MRLTAKSILIAVYALVGAALHAETVLAQKPNLPSPNSVPRILINDVLLHGHVVNATTGQPVAGAKIEVLGRAEGGLGIQTDSEGKYAHTLRGPLAGFLTHITCYAPPFAITYQDVPRQKLLDGASELQIDFALEPGASIRGRVVLKGTQEPLSGMEVTLLKSGPVKGQFSPYHNSATQRTDGDGWYRVDAIRPDTYQIRVNTNSFVKSGHNFTAVEIREKREYEIPDLIVEESVDLDGIVVNASNEPIVDARVMVRAENLSIEEFKQLPRSGDTGHFTLTGLLTEMTYILFASADGYANSGPTYFSIPDTGEKPDLRVVLARSARLSGTVRFENGASAEGTEVRLHPIRGPGSPLNGATRVVRTDASGKFDFQDLEAGGYRLEANHKDPEVPGKAKIPVSMEVGEVRDDFELVVRAE